MTRVVPIQGFEPLCISCGRPHFRVRLLIAITSPCGAGLAHVRSEAGSLVATEKRSLITGLTGQDGGHLTELLHSKGYEVFGLLRGQSNARREALEAEFPFTNLIEADLTDQTSLIQAVGTSAPTEIYNLGAISHVGYSFRNPQLTTDITAKGVLNPLEAMRITGFDRKSRFYS